MRSAVRSQLYNLERAPSTGPHAGLYQSYPITAHARQRMAERRITELDVDMVLRYGREFHKDGARVITIGRREARSLPFTERLRRSAEGIQVVLSPDGCVLSVYRNRNLHRLKVLADPRRARRRPRWRVTHERGSQGWRDDSASERTNL